MAAVAERPAPARRSRHALPHMYRQWEIGGVSVTAALASIAAAIRLNWEAYWTDGQPLHVVVTSKKPPRNQQQNARLWALLTLMESVPVDGKRFPKDAWHEVLKGEFLGWNDLPGGGRMPRSTADLSVSEFADYMTAVEAHLNETYGVYLPDAA